MKTKNTKIRKNNWLINYCYKKQGLPFRNLMLILNQGTTEKVKKLRLLKYSAITESTE